MLKYLPTAKQQKGASLHPLWPTWHMMLNRCYDETSDAFRWYGGHPTHPVRVCKRWHTFEDFVADMGEKPSPRHQLSRQNPNGPYSKANVRWELPEQNLRRSRTVRRVKTKAGEATLADAARDAGINPDTARQRTYRGMSPSQAITAPKGVRPDIAAKYGHAPELKRATIMKFARDAGVTYQRLRTRLADGMTVAEAIADIRASKHGELARRARAAGIRPNTLTLRLRRGLSMEQAVSLPLYSRAA